jgi:acyl carrier protein
VHKTEKKLTEIFDEHGITIRNEDEKIEADSLVYISIIVDIEDQFDLQIPDDFLYDERLLYFSDFVSLVNELTKDQCSKEQ